MRNQPRRNKLSRAQRMRQDADIKLALAMMCWAVSGLAGGGVVGCYQAHCAWPMVMLLGLCWGMAILALKAVKKWRSADEMAVKAEIFEATGEGDEAVETTNP